MTSNTKELPVIIIAILCMLLAVSCSTYTAASNSIKPVESEEIIRFHVTASSDEVFDQELKLIVRDEVLDAINKKLVHETMMKHDPNDSEATLTIDESRDYIKNNLREIEKVAEDIIREKGYDYEVKAELGMSWIPEKKYGDVTFPAGNYEALNITIGEGAGENWWCVLFPPLCIIDTQSKEESEIEADGINSAEWITDESGWPANGTVKLKFKTVEIIDSLKN
jgi:stage II sporulation protein R